MADVVSAFHHSPRLGDLTRGPVSVTLSADEVEREAIAGDLRLLGLGRLGAKLTVRAWLDGAEISGRFTATVTQECGVTLDPFDSDLEGEVFLRVVPPGSPHAPAESGEVELDPEAEDPPDVMQGAQIDLGAIVIEHLALSLDPFPRKPGAEFEPPPTDPVESPFAALKAFKTRDESR